jgi:hypothetical protein
MPPSSSSSQTLASLTPPPPPHRLEPRSSPMSGQCNSLTGWNPIISDVWPV